MHSHDRSIEFAPANDAGADGEPSPASVAPVRAMVVEDQVLIALSLIADLASLGCSVVARAATGERAIAEARRAKPDIVFMDVDLAGAVDGIEAARRILETETTRIVFITALADGGRRPGMDALHPMAILGKPYEHADLARLVAGAARRTSLGGRAARRA